MPRKTPALRALEKNILKFRALQIVLLLHHVEALKSYVFGSIEVTESIFTKSKLDSPRHQPASKRGWKKLVEIGILTVDESNDIQSIISIRNDIGHRAHNLFCDISGPEFVLDSDPAYDYRALQRLSAYRTKIESGMRTHFVQEIGFRELSFEQAELTLLEELRRLDRRINRQMEARRRQITEGMPNNSFKPTPLRGAA
ncbi:hypothetical protein [Luteimonas abyssi]|uniref:hypothetical protein n=1 Tax=Luteimonas abyssi TaxID=1247514 RepID=UPI000AE30E33|nr:hypothetical protein [Luteimonas abyssi]